MRERTVSSGVVSHVSGSRESGASLRGGLDPDLLDEVIWWNSDDYWRYALFAVVAVIRAGAQLQGVPVARIVEQLAERHDLELR
jgi:hypothetical protein